MFDNDELDEIRENGGDWAAPVDEDDREHQVSVGRFLGSMSSSLIIVAVLVALVVSTNMAVGIAFGQAGGFSVFFPKLEGEQLDIYPAVGESSMCKKNFTGFRPSSSSDFGLPVLKADIKRANITRGPIELTKDIPTPFIPSVDVVRINMTQNLGGDNEWEPSNVFIGNTSLQLTNLSAESVVLSGGAQIYENFSNRSPTNTGGEPIFGPGNGYPYTKDGALRPPAPLDYGQFHISGTNADMVNGSAVAYFLGFRRLKLNNLTLNLEYNPSNPLYSTAQSDCPAIP